MITHIKDYTKVAIPPSDVCIIGSGAAGLEIARHLDRTSLSITLIESGYEDYDWRVQKLGRFQQVGRHISSADHSQHFDMQVAKQKEVFLRKFGGTLNIWGRQWAAMDPSDFLEKAYTSESGWPLSFDEIYPYYCSVAEEYDIKEVLPKESLLNITLLTAPYSCFSRSVKIKQTVQTNIKMNFLRSLERSGQVRLILGATAVQILLSEDLKHVKEIVLRSLNKQEWRVSSKYFILACNTIENTRLLLNSNTQIKNGIGNEKGMVGRNLLDHPKAKAGHFVLYPPHQHFPEALPHNIGSNKLARFDISIAPHLRKEWEIPNHSIRFYYSRPKQVERLIKMEFYLEQLPNLESRIFLSDEYDELGMPLACLDWQLREKDKIGFRRFVEKMNFLLTSNNLGKLMLDETIYDMQSFKDASHLMGTTRMAKTPDDGVVDHNCKVFRLDNLYIAGSSIFPSGGSANPTFTIMALAHRLADHLKTRAL